MAAGLSLREWSGDKSDLRPVPTAELRGLDEGTRAAFLVGEAAAAASFVVPLNPGKPGLRGTPIKRVKNCIQHQKSVEYEYVWHFKNNLVVAAEAGDSLQKKLRKLM